jgi:hypothetical protein
MLEIEIEMLETAIESLGTEIESRVRNELEQVRTWSQQSWNAGREIVPRADAAGAHR